MPARELTTDEVREKLLRQIWSLVDYWEHEDRRPDVRGKLSGLAFSILVALDGESCNVPPFIVAPMPHKDDQSYRQQRGKNWYPYNDSDKVKADVAGSLHELFHEFDPRKDS
jgi:hypothetical protein